MGSIPNSTETTTNPITKTNSSCSFPFLSSDSTAIALGYREEKTAMAVEPTGDPAARDDVSPRTPLVPKPLPTSEDEIRAVARKFSDQPVQNPDPGVWAVLTAISKNSRLRPQGMNILLSSDEHCLGRCVEDTRFQIAAIAVSANHCRIFRDSVAVGDGELDPTLPVPVFIKDTSTNGTFLNWTKLRKRSPQARLQHGDIIAFVAPPQDDNSYAFVYREVCRLSSIENGGAVLKRKSEESCADNKRLKGIGIGAPDGPVSLDDVRSLQRSNTELRQQLESHVLTIERLRSEGRASSDRHENELRDLKEVMSNSYIDQIKELQHSLDDKKGEVDVLSALTVELRSSIKDLNERLTASKQSRLDADEIIQSQKATISELEVQLDDERNLRREERENAAADLKSALQKVQAEAQEEIKRHADVYARQHREQQEVISKLQESEKDSRLLVETLRCKLEDARESLVTSEKKVRQLEIQVQDEQLASANIRKKSETLESELKILKSELESEKVAREEAWAKVSALELEISAAIRDLSIEKQRFQGARERIILRETQLRAFYSTTEEISAMFAKQQEQLKAMQKTLEDEDNYDNALVDIDLNARSRSLNIVYPRGTEEAHANNNARETSGASTPKGVQATYVSSSDNDISSTEKHDCAIGSQDGNTQDLECTSADRLLNAFGSDIDGVGTAVVPGEDPTDTERVLGTESQAADAGFDERNTILHKCSNLGGDTMQLDDEVQVQENMEPLRKLQGVSGGCSQSRLEDTETGTVRTADLLASEVAGSWAVSTAPSVNGENESPRSMADDGDDEDANAAAAPCSDGQAAGSQSNIVSGIIRLSEEHRALNAMIGIVAPDFRQQFQDSGCEGQKSDSMSDAETEEGSNDGDGREASDDDEDAEDSSDGGDDPMEGGNEVTIEDSVG
ncbi:uncharacterized protein [Typha latifolia]|uniref:uncharacterized protein isoform X2 n=1 Tax=Typha latifolia TaxID=4733 RepID=UPI003C2DE586